MLLKLIFLCFTIGGAVSESGDIRGDPPFWLPRFRTPNYKTHPRQDGGGRIVGGVEISIEQRPFQVMTYINGRTLCGGAVINQDTILTAAHCFDSPGSPVYKVRLGSASYLTGGILVDVKQFIKHPSYSPYTGYYDVAVVKLAQPVVFSAKIQPIRLATAADDPIDGARAIVSGWGDLLSEGGSYPENLHQVEVPIVNQELCKRSYTHLAGSQLCAGESGRDSCQGDSGGPLTYNGVHIGIVSSGRGCALPGWPGIYTRTSAVRGFIDKYL